MSESVTEMKRRRMEFAIGLVANAWCQPKTEKKTMDPVLAKEFAKILVVEMYKPNLGCATTRELLDEIKARVDLDYTTINGD